MSLSILDFAKDLLFDLKYGKDADMDELDMGKVPIIFVVHSMGGLVVKEARLDSINFPWAELTIHRPISKGKTIQSTNPSSKLSRPSHFSQHRIEEQHLHRP